MSSGRWWRPKKGQPSRTSPLFFIKQGDETFLPVRALIDTIKYLSINRYITGEYSKIIYILHKAFTSIIFYYFFAEYYKIFIYISYDECCHMISGRQIRNARRAKGMTQTQLAESVGISQGFLSLIERSEVKAPKTAQKLAELLDIIGIPSDNETASVQTFDFRGPTIPTEIAAPPVPLVVRRWQRPNDSGDAAVVCRASGDALLVAAIDIAGSGKACRPSATYILGWLRAKVTGDASPVRVDLLAEQLTQEMKEVGIEATFFLAIIRKWDKHGTAQYEGVGSGFPPPLLLSGNPMKSVKSIRGIESDGKRTEIIAQINGSLQAPWRLIVATDGLLTRLGGGAESDGRRLLRRWQSGTRRDQSPSTFLASPVEPLDDELYLSVISDGWDDARLIQAGDESEIRSALGRVYQSALQLVDERKARNIQQATLEAISNARTHAVSRNRSAMSLAYRVESRRVVVEIRDEGPGCSAADINTQERGFAVMKRLCDDVEIRENEAGGTTVSLGVTI